MDFPIYILGLLLIFGFGLLAYNDRLYGIFGMFFGLIFGSFLARDNAIIILGTTYNSATSTWELCMILIFMLTVMDIFIYNHIYKAQKELEAKVREYEESH